MTQPAESIEGLIKTAFALQVAVRSTEDADAICSKNHLTFPELLRPFSQLHSQVQLKDVQGHLYSLKGVRVCFSSPPSDPLPDAKLRMLLSSVVQRAGNEGSSSSSQPAGATASATPWFEAYKLTLLEQLKQSDHECIRSYVSVVLVVSSAHADPLSAFSKLYAAQKESEQSRYPKWLIPHLLYYHVLLHDVSEGNDTRAQENFEKVRATYGGASSFLLQLNSRPPGASDKGIPDPWRQFVSPAHTPLPSEEDLDEVDGPFRSLKARLKNRSKAKERTPDNSQPSVAVATINPNLLRPNVREEAKLIDTDEDLSSVAAGDDPLSQLATSAGDSQGTFPTSDAGEGGEGGEGVRVGQCLSLEDHNRLRAFTHEFVAERLLPHLEAVLKTLNEWLLSRRSVRRSFSHMSSRLMKMLGASNNLAPSDEPSYAHTSIEFQLRTLADIAFMLQSYDLAFQSYHTVKKDFQSASAWLYYAGAVEMCAVSAYLLSSTKREVVSYLEEASSVYNISCKQMLFSLRASLLLAEILKERGMFRELTQLFIKMTAEDADLRSALCLEQAALAFLRIKPSMTRKHALHLILAGHRYAKAAQRVHSTRAYKQALDVYKDKGWALAEDYIHFSLGRHSYSLHRLEEAWQALGQLLSHRSPQSPAQQLLNLKEYIFVHKQLLGSGGGGSEVDLVGPSTTLTQAGRMSSVPRLPLPFIKPQLTRVTFATATTSLDAAPLKLEPAGRSPQESKARSSSLSHEKDSNLLEEELVKSSSVSIEAHLREVAAGGGLVVGTSDYDPARHHVATAEWEELEMRAASGLSGALHENFAPSTLVMDQQTSNSSMPLCTVNEPVAVGVAVSNPLRVPLLMTNVALVWTFTPSGGAEPGSQGGGASCEVIPQIILQPQEDRMLTLHITPLKPGGELQVVGVVYRLCVDGSVQPGGDSPPVPAPSPRPTLPSMAVSSRDSLYQRQQSSSQELAAGIQGVLELTVRGARLNGTKLEKASVVYGQDHRLRWLVNPPMPKLAVCLRGVGRSLLAGELSRVALEVFNCGQVSLNSLRLTSSLAHSLLLELDPTQGRPLYPSSTQAVVSAPPSSPAPCLELPLPHGRLNPGEGVAASLILQAGGRGGVLINRDVPWNLLFYYEPAVINASSRISHRVLRHSVVLKVKECLQLKASATHGQLPASSSGFDMNQLLITVDAENSYQSSGSSALEVRLTQVSCVSTVWEARRLDAPGQGVLCLRPSEGGAVQLKASRCREEEGAELRFSDVPLGDTKVLSSGFPAGELFRGSEVCRVLQGGAGEGKELNSSSSSTSLAAAADGSSKTAQDFALVVFWQALLGHSGAVCGHHTLRVALPQSLTALYQEPTSRQSPYDLVKYHLEHPASVHHCFTSGPSPSSLCQVPVRVVLQNCCQATVHATVELLQPRDSVQHEQRSPRQVSIEPGFFWSGGTCRRHLTLEANSTAALSVFANVCQPGSYCMSSLRVSVGREGGAGAVLQRWTRTSYLIVD